MTTATTQTSQPALSPEVPVEGSTPAVPVAENAPKPNPVAPAAAAPFTRPQVSASLYIGDLDPEIGESVLYDLFKDIGNVTSIRVCRDAISKVSLGYAYVNFHNTESADQALANLNGYLLNGRPCRIMWSRRDPSIRKSGVGNIFIKNLDPSVDHANLYDIFSSFGNIHSCKLATNAAGLSRGFGFVHFHTQDSADTAIKKMNNLKVNGKQIYVAPFISARDRQRKNPNDVFTNVYIKNIDESVSQEDFQKYFEQFGQITSAKLMNTDQPSKTRFGFVNYMTHEEAIKCVETTVNTEFHGKTLYAGRAQSRAERLEELRKRREESANKYQGQNLYIKNIDDGVDEEKLRKAFAEFGGITSVKIMTNDKGSSKGFGFVCFSKRDEAQAALTKMNNQMLDNKPLYVALAQRKEQRRAQLEAHYAQRNIGRIAQPGTIGMAPIYPGPLFYPPSVGNPNQTRYMYPPQITQQYRRGFSNAPQQPAGYVQNQIYPGQNRRGNSNQPRGNIAGGGRGGVRPNVPQHPAKAQPRPAQEEVAPVDDSRIQLANLIFEKLENNHAKEVAERIAGALVSSRDEATISQLLADDNEFNKATEEVLATLQQ
jgi:polyadenylate-binding protein